MHECDARRIARTIVNSGVRGLEDDLPARRKARSDQILHHFVLSVYGDGAAAGELVHIDTMAAAVKTKFDTVMNQTFAPQTLAGTGLMEQIHGALFEYARADPLFDVFASLRLDYDGLDALKMEQMGKQEARRPGSHDAHLRAEFHGSGHASA